jgi:hypothetical protein
MKATRISRQNNKPPRERVREQHLRDRIQAEKPSLDDLIQSGDCSTEDVMTMGMYVDMQTALQALRKERTLRGLSIGDVANRSGLDRAVISRLECGKQANPTMATLMRYAAGIGKRFLWTFKDLEGKTAGRVSKEAGRRTRRSG